MGPITCPERRASLSASAHFAGERPDLGPLPVLAFIDDLHRQPLRRRKVERPDQLPPGESSALPVAACHSVNGPIVKR